MKIMKKIVKFAPFGRGQQADLGWYYTSKTAGYFGMASGIDYCFRDVVGDDGTVREVGLGKSDFILRKVLGVQV